MARVAHTGRKCSHTRFQLKPSSLLSCTAAQMMMQELHRTTSSDEKYIYRFIFKQIWNHLKLFGLVFGLVVLFILTATPVYFYYVIPPLNSPVGILRKRRMHFT